MNMCGQLTAPTVRLGYGQISFYALTQKVRYGKMFISIVYNCVLYYIILLFF